MASANTTRVVLGCWTGAAAFSGVYTYTYLKDFEKRVPCIQDAVRTLADSKAARAALGDGDLRVPWWSARGQVDKVAGRSFASFQVAGDLGNATVYIGSTKRPQAPGFVPVEDEDMLEMSSFAYYWSRPWEIKFAFLNKLRWLRGMDPLAPLRASPGSEDDPWDLQAVFILPSGDASQPLEVFGSARAIPDYESVVLRRDSDAKGERSRRRLQIFGGLAFTAALVAAGLRVTRSMRVSKSYGFAKRGLLAHPHIVESLGAQASVQTSSGTFGPSYINAQLRLVGTTGSAADVRFTATRDGTKDGPWRVLMAKMSFLGKHRELDRVHF